MKRINPVLEFISTVCDFIALNLLFLITCLPIVTIGAALSSLYYVTLKEARGESGYLVRPYLREFKKNLRQGIAAFTILLVFIILLGTAAVFWYGKGTAISSLILGIIVAVCIAWYLIFTYTFPLIGRFQNTTRQTFKNAFGIAMGNIKATLMIFLIDAVVISLYIMSKKTTWFLLVIGFAFIAYCKSYIIKKVFAPYECLEESEKLLETE